MGTPGLLCVKLRMNRHRIAAVTLLLTNKGINRPLFRSGAQVLYFFNKKKHGNNMCVIRGNLRQQSYKEPPITEYRVVYIEILFRR